MELKRKFFTTIGKGHGAPCLPSTKEDWLELRRAPWLKEMCARIEKGDDELKNRLPVWTPSCAEFANNHRSIADALKPLNRLMIDFDDKGHTMDIMSKLGLETSKAVMSDKGIKVLLIEDSARRGTHVLLSIPTGMTAEEAQKIMQEITGFEPDKSLKDVSRCIYMVTDEHTKYVSEELFDIEEGENEVPVPTTPSPVAPTSEAKAEEEKEESEPMFKNIPYSSIVKEWWLRSGGEPQEGERNVKLHKLAVNLRAICDNKKSVLMRIMPRMGLSETELGSIVDSACKEQPKGISKKMQSILDDIELGVSSDEFDDEDEDSENSNGSVSVNYSKLPLGLKESMKGVPASMRMPVICSVLPIAAAYADGVEVEYCDGMRQHLGLMSIIRGEQASGKSVCKNVVDIWKRQFDEEDALARKREDEWKERKKGRKANEKAPDDPKVLIRMVPVTVSCSTLLKRFKNANGHCIYSFGEELDTLRKTNGAGSWSSKYDIYRLSFDRGEWGQDYNSDQAESGVVKVAYNWTLLGTNGAMQKCFKQDNIENGLSSRILVSEMPDTSFAKMPKYGKRSADDEARIQEAVTRLRSFSGFLDTPRLRKAIERWVEEKRVEAAKDIDRVKDTYRKRAAVIGFRAGAIFHMLSGEEKESRACLAFATDMAEYCLGQQIAAFGEALQNEYVNARDECMRYGANHSIFDQLPPTFSIEDLKAIKKGFYTISALRTTISRWRKDGWVEKIDRNHWKKQLIQ